MLVDHFDGGDVIVVDVRDPRRRLSGVSEVVLEAGRALVVLSGANAHWAGLDVMTELGFDSPEQIPAYSIRSRATSELHWCGPVRLAWT